VVRAHRHGRPPDGQPRLLSGRGIDVLYIAVPHHLHERLYSGRRRGRHRRLAEKPFGIDLAAGQRIVAAIKSAGVFVRCSREMPFAR
jgi:predicted dehydrogenase